MCVGRETFNLCKCGCTEADHEEGIDLFGNIAREGLGGIFTWRRGKCQGRKLLPQDPASSKPVFEQCSCDSFDPVFKDMCGGF